MAVIDHYIRQLEDHLEDMEDAAATVGGEVNSIKRKLHEQEQKVAELNRAIDAFLLEENEVMAMSAQGKLNSTQRLIITYQEQLAHLEDEYQKLRHAKLKLEDRLLMISQQREELQALLDLSKSKEIAIKAMKGLGSLRNSNNTDVSRLAQDIYTRLDKASAATEIRAASLEEEIDQVLDRSTITSQLAERKKKLLQNE